MRRLEPELGMRFIGLKSRICPRCGGYIVWEPRVNIDHGYRYFCIMCNREFGEVFEPLIFRKGEIKGRDRLRALSAGVNEVSRGCMSGRPRRVAIR